jgi:hypothetical protein
MSNAPAILRSLIIYAVCVPLAVAVGYMVTNPMDYSTLGAFGILAVLLASPLLMRWHYPWLVLSLQMSCTLFFIKGAPTLWLVMVVLSLGISVLERTLNSERHFIRVPQITWPLLCLAGVVLMTAKLTGGFGLHAFGSDVYGGKKYVFMVAGILLYFALTARRIPAKQARLYVTLYFFGGLLSFIGDLYPIAPSWAHFVFWIFPPSTLFAGPYEVGETRLGGFSGTGVALACLIMARYGIRGIFLSGKPWRLAVFILAISFTFLGGYRAALLAIVFIFVVQFFLEGLHRTKLLLLFALVGTLAFTALIPLASKLPFTAQRTLAFLPLNLDTQARESAQDTLDWRIQMWTALLPQVPEHLLLGKGLAISPEEYNEMMGNTALATTTGQFDPSQNSLALAYDYHNGTLSVLIPFGIWGAITFLWFLIASLRVMYANFRYGDPALQTINIFLFANFFVTFVFFFIGGSLNGDIMRFAGLLGLSISLNGGVCRPVPQPAQAGRSSPPAEAFSRLRPGFQR